MSVELKIQLSQISPSAAEAVIGEHRVTIDRPSSKGESGMGPMGGELFLAAVAGCFMSNLLARLSRSDHSNPSKPGNSDAR